MSHFTVLVITDTVDGVDKALAPFHEFECTGLNDEYVQDIDKTEEYRKDWQTGTKSMIRDAAGTLHDAYGNQFYRDPTPEEASEIMGGMGSIVVNGERISYVSQDWGDGLGYRSKVKFTPEGWEKVDVPYPELMTFAEYLTDYEERAPLQIGEKPDLSDGGPHKFGYVVVAADGSVVRAIRRTNPSSRWDWWQLGGRWSGRLKVKPGAVGTKGRAGVMGSQYSSSGVDQCLAEDLDLDGMLAEARRRNANCWDSAEAAYKEQEDNLRRQSVAGGADKPLGLTLEEALARYGELIDGFVARIRDPENTDKQPLYKMIEENSEADLLRSRLGRLDWEHGIRPEAKNREHHISQAVALSTHAVIRNGQWYESGKMGWWGAVHDEKDEQVWSEQFNALLRDLPPKAVISVVDCHI